MSVVKNVRARVKRSEFIGFIEDCNSLDELNNIVKMYKKRYHDAKQICYASVFNNTEIFNDDKEPSGTSGIVMLNELKKFNISGKVIIIVRYFGGVKLGRKLLKETYLGVAISVLSALNK